MNIEWLIISKMIFYAIFLWPKKKIDYENILESIPAEGISAGDLFHTLYISGYIPKECHKWQVCFYESLTEMAREKLIYYDKNCYIQRT